MGFFDKLKRGLEKSKISFGFNKVDEELLETLEEELIMSDVGFETSEEIINDLRNKIKKEKITDTEEVKMELKSKLNNVFEGIDSSLDIYNSPAVILMVGVNGAGKTTSIGKIASKLKLEGKKVLIAAGDTFRAAAVEQLEEWANRAGCEIIKGNEGADPASVIFDACRKAKNEEYDVLICDTAGRLQNKSNLMDELKKIKKVIDRELPDSSKETILVLDGSIGQNAISQVESFKECTGLTGLIVTKLDGTAKGGIVIRLVSENRIPIKFIGVGEKIDDMEVFNSLEFVDAIVS
ncbi:MAG: signal recognition particle-docking protein FtsY [Clostridia bacterium]|nr:signal recognition particle-docking protein FtsY [Clostridia bacterium]